MGDVTADGAQLWLSGRYSSEVYVVDTRSGKLLHRIRPTRARTGCSSGLTRAT